MVIAPTGLVPLDAPPLVLASGSVTRRAMLEAAGVPLAGRRSADIDEAVIRAGLRDHSVEQVALALAETKARTVAAECAGHLVLGADQMLETAEGAWLEKPPDRAAARRQLWTLRGTTHRLIAAAVLVRDGTVVWQATDTARLTMRAFDEAFLDTYLDNIGPAVTTSVGGYQLEGLGVQLFSAIEGDHFTILGLPMLPLLAALRTQGVLSP